MWSKYIINDHCGLAVYEVARKVSLVGMHVSNNVEHSSQMKCDGVHTWEQKKCWMMLKTMFDGCQTLVNIIQHCATWWPNECNMLDSTMLDDVASTCWINLACHVTIAPLQPLRNTLILAYCTEAQKRVRWPPFFIIKLQSAYQDSSFCQVLKTSVEQVQSLLKYQKIKEDLDLSTDLVLPIFLVVKYYASFKLGYLDFPGLFKLIFVLFGLDSTLLF